MMDQIPYVIHQLHYNIYLVYKFQPAIMNECKVIHKQPPIRTQILSFLTIFDGISQLTSIYFHDGSNYICDPSTTLLYLPCVQIPTYYNERMRSSSQTTSDKDSNFVIFDHFDSNSRLIQFIFMMDQITYVIHQLHYYIYLVYKFQLTIINECKVIHKQPPIRTQIRSFFTIFDSISRLTSIRLEFEPNYISYQSTTLLYLPCVHISTYYN